MISFYIKNIAADIIVLDREESNHCIRVMRLKLGDRVQLHDGKGFLFEALIADPNPQKCALKIVGKAASAARADHRLTIAIAPTKNIDRFEWFLEKSTEIGIDKIIPIICQRSERKDLKTERLEKIMISAMKQSGQSYLPELTQKTSFKDLMDMPFNGDKFIAHCEEVSKILLQQAVTPGKDVLILIGPEGDFEGSEITLALQKGYLPVSLGASRLRTETAGIVACHTVCLVNNR